MKEVCNAAFWPFRMLAARRRETPHQLFQQLLCSLAPDSVFRVMWCMQTCPRYKHSRIYVTQGCTFNKEKAPGKNDPAERRRQKQAREAVISQNTGSPSPGSLAVKVRNVNSPFFWNLMIGSTKTHIQTVSEYWFQWPPRHHWNWLSQSICYCLPRFFVCGLISLIITRMTSISTEIPEKPRWSGGHSDIDKHTNQGSPGESLGGPVWHSMLGMP